MSSTGKSPEDRPEGGNTGSSGLTRALRDAAPFLGLGTTLAGAVLLGVGGGYWLDAKLGTRPVFFLIGAVLGLGAAGLQFYRMLVQKKP